MNKAKIQLDVPLNDLDVKHRGLDPSLCKILYECQTREDETCLTRISAAIESCRSNNGNIFITSVGEFDTIDTLEKLEGVSIFKKHNLVIANSKEAIKNTLKHWDAEALVMFFSDTETAKNIVSRATHLEDQWWRYKEGSYDQNFLSQVKLGRVFVFYSTTHRSIEIIGYEQEIRHCYKCLKEVDLK